MKIIDNKKDYYDYLSGVYGIDELIVFDRRGSVMLKSDNSVSKGVEDCFCTLRLPTDKPVENKRRWELRRVVKWKEASKDEKYHFSKTWPEGIVLHYILEVGWNQYYFEVERWAIREKPRDVMVDYRLIETRLDVKDRFSDYPVCIIPCEVGFSWWTDTVNWKELAKEPFKRINNPIMSNTYIPKIIPATDVWGAVYEYLSSRKEKPITDLRTDIQKLEAAGFDKKTSFRG